MNNGYKVLLLTIVNNRLVRAFKARLNGGHLEIAGKTGTGKTTATSVLWEILSPGSDRITHGEKKSTLTAVLSNGEDQITATRNYLPSGSNVSIVRQGTNEDGILETKPISAKEFKLMLSPLSSNPHDVKSMPSKAKVQLLLQSAGIPVGSYEALDVDVAKAAADLGVAQTHRKDHVPGDEPEKADPVNAEALSLKITEINDHNAQYDIQENNVRDAKDRLQSIEKSRDDEFSDIKLREEAIHDYKARLEILEQDNKVGLKKLVELDKSIGVVTSEVENEIEALSEMGRIPPEEISKEVEEAARLNEIAGIHKQWEDRVKADKAASESLSNAQKAHKAALKAKKLVMDGAEFPLTGLTIEDGDLWYNDILVDNLGESEQMLVYGSLSIEDALSHDIRAVRMDGIESMGQEDYVKLRDLATEKGVQLFTTRVTWDEDIQDTEILIVDGQFPAAEAEQE